MTCTDAQPLISRYADDEQSLAPGDREALEAHLAGCAACRAELEAQREVAGLLRARLETPVRPGLAARVAARIDREATEDAGWLGLANWRAWTVGLAPVAAALLVAAYLDVARAGRSESTQPSAPAFQEWAIPSSNAAAVFLQPSATGDALIEAVLTGAVPSSAEIGHER